VLNQLEKTVGAQMTKAIAKENKRQMIAAGRPLFAGVPEE
jgi:predicted ArsR family transcriptional regulator